MYVRYNLMTAVQIRSSNTNVSVIRQVRVHNGGQYDTEHFFLILVLHFMFARFAVF